MEAYSCTEYAEISHNSEENKIKSNLDLLLDVNHPDGKYKKIFKKNFFYKFFKIFYENFL
jgi:hypothetical protein